MHSSCGLLYRRQFLVLVSLFVCFVLSIWIILIIYALIGWEEECHWSVYERKDFPYVCRYWKGKRRMDWRYRKVHVLHELTHKSTYIYTYTYVQTILNSYTYYLFKHMYFHTYIFAFICTLNLYIHTYILILIFIYFMLQIHCAVIENFYWGKI